MYVRLIHNTNSALKGFLFIIASIVVILVFFSGTKKTDERPELVDLKKELRHIEIKNKYCIAIVAEGIPKSSPIKGRQPIEKDSQGYDMFEGARAAIEGNIIDTSLIDFLYIDDENNINYAKKIAEILSESSAVLCVIGHASSSATLAALPYYKKAGIPIIMPIATNPTLTQGFETTAFRMPNNDAYQSAFISDFAIQELKSDNICIIWDEDATAKEYSKYLKEKLEKTLGLRVKETMAINSSLYDIQPNSKKPAVEIFIKNKPDLIIYCGYGSLGKKFLTVLNSEYTKNAALWKHKPNVILTDGCNAPDITRIYSELLFNAYMSYPCELGKDMDCLKEVIAKNKESFNSSYSYELFGYDAVNLLASVIKGKIKKELSRNSVSEELRKGQFTVPTCYSYTFKDGENQSLSYSIYSLDSLKLIKKYTSKNVIK